MVSTKCPSSNLHIILKTPLKEISHQTIFNVKPFFSLLTNFLLSLSPSTDEYKSKVVCEEDKMRLSCKQGMQIAVYSAMFGRTLQGTLECPLHHRRAPSVGEQMFYSHIVTVQACGIKNLLCSQKQNFKQNFYSLRSFSHFRFTSFDRMQKVGIILASFFILLILGSV